MATDADQVVQEATRFFFRVDFTSACSLKKFGSINDILTPDIFAKNSLKIETKGQLIEN